VRDDSQSWIKDTADRCPLHVGHSNLEGEGKEQGLDLTFKGDVEGADTWYFAYKEGLYVKMDSSASIKGTITTSGGQNMTIPLTQKLRMDTRLTR